MKIISKHPYNGEKIGNIKTIYMWNKNNPYDKINLTKSEGFLTNYPVCCKILSNIKHEQLYDDYKKHEDYLLQQTGTYLKEWFKTRNINWEDAKQELSEVNFVATEYRQFNIMEMNDDTQEWTSLLPWVEEYTRSVLKQFNTKVIRARYSIAYPGWHLKPHIDYPHPKYNGFRVHIPVFTEENVNTFFLIDDEWCEMYMEPGFAWFMNVSVPHKINHNGKHNRIYLTLDLWDDKIIPLSYDHRKIKYHDL